jgi:hypothetical protein
MRTTLFVLAAIVGALAFAVPALSGVSQGTAIYVNGVGYRTVGTPTDFTGTGAPDSAFQPIYSFGSLQPSVATAAPGDAGYRGGRWIVWAVSFGDYAAAVNAYDENNSGDFDSYAELAAAVGGGAATLTNTGIRFECPVIPTPKNR